MPDKTQRIDAILAIMRDHWDLPADCNEGELFGWAEILLDRIEAGEAPAALYAWLSNVQSQALEMPASDAARRIVDGALAAGARVRRIR